MSMRPCLAALILCATAATAQPTLTAEEFDNRTRGKTFIYGNAGAAYGAEEYLDNRRVRWSFLDGRCEAGRWYAQDGLICFVYENLPDPQCWSFTENAGGLIARFENDQTRTELYEMSRSKEPLMCLGPEVGA